MCGILGVVAHTPVNQLLYDGLVVLQHRGQDAAGIVTAEGNMFHLHKGMGLVRDVFRTRNMRSLLGNMGIAHVRYPTAGSASSVAEAQPFYVNSPYGIVLAHNGNLTNADALKEEMFRLDRRHINTNSDSEVLLNVFAHELQKRARSAAVTAEVVFDTVRAVHQRCRGAYAVVAMIAGHGLVAFRDPYGIRPLVVGEHQTAAGPEYLVASESVALDTLGFKLLRDVAPGEALFIDMNGKLSFEECADNAVHAPCIFEFVYLARPDSVIDGISVYESRLHMGSTLAKKIQRTMPELKIDVVIPIPDTSRPSAMQLAHDLGVPYREGFIKNRYIGRTFIMPGQGVRKKSVRQKLNPIASEFQGRTVLLVDDSIVRGTTSKEIVQMAREAGAAQVIFASAAPPVRFPYVYGIDMPSRSELLATGRDDQAIADAIGADGVVYQDLEGLEEAVRAVSPESVRTFETSCFSGHYITDDITAEYLAQIENNRGEGGGKSSDGQSSLNVDLNLGVAEQNLAT